MKKFALTMMVLGLVACGVKTSKVDTAAEALEDAGRTCSLESNFVGSWNNTINGEILTIASNCLISTDQCHVLGVTTQAEEVKGKIFLAISASDGTSNCLPVGEISCNYDLSANTLEVTCTLENDIKKTFRYTK